VLASDHYGIEQEYRATMSWKKEKRKDDFPWHIGVFDAHCHPTDTMDSIASIPNMHAKVLTVMATREQDQDLVQQVAETIGLDSQAPYDAQWDTESKIIPCFGWHPWFSHQMFDQADYDDEKHYADDIRALTEKQKIQHYQSVLVPKSDDKDFLLSLPDPKPFSHFLSQTRARLEKYPLALIGEVGLDKAFRIPEAWLPDQKGKRDDNLTPGGREGRRLSPYRVSMDHQKKLLHAQLNLAGETNRAVSVHGVQVHGILQQFLTELWKGHERKVLSKREQKREKAAQAINADTPDPESGQHDTSSPKLFPPRICLHSFSGPLESAKQYLDPKIPAQIFFSFSEVINFDRPSSKAEEVIKMLPENMILVESDLHTAGERMDGYLEDIVRRICGIKGWGLEEGVRVLGRNWRKFAFGEQGTEEKEGHG
jgi:Tat protein secretion system quality control protein TatD with DNase activity